MFSPAHVRAFAAFAALAFAVTLGACSTATPEAPHTTPTTSEASPGAPASSQKPLFSTEKEALAAATKAYAAYLRVVDAIGRDGGAGLERLRDVTTGEQLVSSTDSLTYYTEKNVRATGTTVFDSVSLQKWDARNSSASIYVCEDVSDIDMTDSNGKSIVSADREDRLPFIADFETASGKLSLSHKDLWLGDNFCQ
ncbi:MAG TPA: hypothetical protein VFQ96_07270 [Microbacteriaceae bacterium]|nr:hypothetical protein [Microbacteriaceae bacterium]